MRAAFGMCALLASFGFAACDAGAKPEPPLSGSDRTMSLARVIIVKSTDAYGRAQEVVLDGSLADPGPAAELRTMLGEGYSCTEDKGHLHCWRASFPTCGAVMDHLNSALFTYEPAYMPLAATYAPRVLASCHQDGWPDALRQCIVESSPRALLDHACDGLVSDELARKVIARLGVAMSPDQLLRR